MSSNIFFDPYPQLTEDSEKRLIQPILERKLFTSVKINRYLAVYPSAKENQKAEVIIKIMEELWKEKKFFTTFKAFDFYLATSGKRGHFVHQFEVYLLGLNFLLLFFDKKKVDLPLDFGVTEFHEVTFSWLIASSAHDFGYPIEGANKILEKLAKLYTEFKLEYLADRFEIGKFDKIISKEKGLSAISLRKRNGQLNCSYFDLRAFVTRSVSKTLGISLKKACALEASFVEKNRHGYASALMLSRLVLSDLLKDDSLSTIRKSPKFGALSNAAGAVAVHNLDPESEIESKFIGKITYEKNPIAYLLFIIDNIQDWGRTLFPDEDYPEYKLDQYTLSDRHMTFDYHILHEEWGEEVLKKVDVFLNAKAKLFENIKKPTDSFKLLITLNFKRNDGYVYPTVEFEI